MILGIDLGTTFSVAASITKDNEIELINNAEGSHLTPSVVLFDEVDGIIVGTAAKEAGIVCSDNVVVAVKNEMGKKKVLKTFKNIDYNPEMISSLIIRKLVKDAEAYTGQNVNEIVITVPAYFNDAQRKATEDAATIANVKLAGIINEPTAAALCYTKKHDVEDKNVLIYDLGGGTFDATLLHAKDCNNIKILSTGGMSKTGGYFLDEMIAEYVCEYICNNYDIDLNDDEYAEEFHEILLKSEKAKKELSNKSKAIISIRIGSIKEKIEIKREWFESEKILGKMYMRTENKIKNVLKEANLKVDDIDIVLLAGGSSRIPFIEKKLTEFTGKCPSKEENPDEVVAIGAALYAEFNSSNNEKKFTDVCSHSIGVVVNNRDGTKESEIIIPRNTEIPVRMEKSFKTAVKNQKKLELTVTEGEYKELTDINTIGDFEIEFPENVPLHSRIIVKIGLDNYQIINIKVSLPEVGFEEEGKLQREANMDENTLISVTGMLRDIEVN